MREQTMRQIAPSRGEFVFYPSSETGSRSRNEDNYLVVAPGNTGATATWLRDEKPVTQKLSGWPAGFVRVAVADGMGGHAGGREIAQAAIEGLLKVPPFQSVEEARSGVLRLHETLYEQFATHNDRSPGTTLVVVDLELQTGLGFVCTVGDSRAYKVRGSGVQQLTRDHTRDEFEWRDGGIPEWEYRQSLVVNTNEIVQALGHGSFGLIKETDGYKPNRFERQIRIDARSDLSETVKDHADVFPFSLEPDAALMLASDGLWNPTSDGCWWGPLTGHFCSEAETQSQSRKAMNSSSKDNITLVIFGCRQPGEET